MKKSSLPFTWLIAIFSYTFLYLPIFILIIFSFNSEHFPSYWNHFTLKWYKELFNSSTLWHSFFISLFVATFSTLLSLTMAVGLIFFRMQGGKVQKFLPIFYGNLIIPETMLAISLLTYFTFLKVNLGVGTLIIAHTILGLGFTIPILYTRYLQIDSNLYEASESLGASSYKTFLKVFLPMLKPTMIATSLLIFILSFDDFILSYFCAGTSVQTLTLYLLSMLKTGISPVVNALATILILLSGVLAMFFFSPKIRNKVL